MSGYGSRFLIAIFLLCAACTSKGHSDLSKALMKAVKDEKLSSEKMENILREYDRVRDHDPEKAREYGHQVIKAIEMGGDSSHIDVARRSVSREAEK